MLFRHDFFNGETKVSEVANLAPGSLENYEFLGNFRPTSLEVPPDSGVVRKGAPLAMSLLCIHLKGSFSMMGGGCLLFSFKGAPTARTSDIECICQGGVEAVVLRPVGPKYQLISNGFLEFQVRGWDQARYLSDKVPRQFHVV